MEKGAESRAGMASQSVEAVFLWSQINKQINKAQVIFKGNLVDFPKVLECNKSFIKN